MIGVLWTPVNVRFAGGAANTPRPIAQNATTKPKGLEWEYHLSGAPMRVVNRVVDFSKYSSGEAFDARSAADAERSRARQRLIQRLT